MERTTIMLADDQGEFLALVARILGPEFIIVKSVDDGEAVIEEAAKLAPDIVVLDFSMPKLDGIETAQRLTASGCSAKIIFLTVHSDPDYVQAALATGARGYVVKYRLATDLLIAIREVLAGRLFVSPALS